MINIDDILEDGDQMGCGVSYTPDSFVMKYSGGLYPFQGGNLLNPLDPLNLILSWEIINDDTGLEDGSDEDREFERVLDTMLAVTSFRKRKYEIITRYKSGAARAIKLLDGSDKVVILGDYARDNGGLILPILSTQLSDNYRQEDIPAWKEFGFRTPPHYEICTSEQDYRVDGVNDIDVLEGTDEVTYYDIIGGGKKVVIKKVHREAEKQEISDSEDRDWDYGWVEGTAYSITVHKDSSYHPTTPNFVWEEKQ